MGDFDVRFRNYENAMHANNNFGLSGQALADQYGRYTVGLQQADVKAKNKAEGRAFAKDLARERALARQDYVNFWNREFPKYEALKKAELASRPFSITAGQIENQFGLNRTLMSGADRADYIKFWEQNVPQTQATTTANKPMTWERYAQEHGTVYRKPTNGVAAADKIAEKQIRIGNLNKDITRLQGFLAENPDVQTLINAKQAEVANLQNEISQIKSGLQTPKVNPVASTPVAPEATPAPKAAPKPTAIWAYPEDAPATPEAPQTEAPKTSVTPEAPQAEKPIKPKKAGKGLGKFFKGKKGKVALVAGLALAGLALLKACSDDKKPEAPAENPEPVKPTPTPAAPVENPEQGENPTPAVPVENPEEGTTPAPVQPEQPAQPVASENIIQNGDSLEDVANRYGVTVEQLKELNADKIKHFKTADGKVIDGFIVGEDIKLPDGTAKVEDLKTKDETVADYEEYLVKNFDQIPQSMWNQVCTPEFRRRHKLGEYKEAA